MGPLVLNDDITAFADDGLEEFNRTDLQCKGRILPRSRGCPRQMDIPERDLTIKIIFVGYFSGPNVYLRVTVRMGPSLLTERCVAVDDVPPTKESILGTIRQLYALVSNYLPLNAPAA